jgi:hypothetical protein
MESKGSLPCLQPTTGPYRGLDASKDTHSHPVPLRSIPILSSNVSLGLSSGLFPPNFQVKILYAFLMSVWEMKLHTHTKQQVNLWFYLL